jgi:hypothetical protein
MGMITGKCMQTYFADYFYLEEMNDAVKDLMDRWGWRFEREEVCTNYIMIIFTAKHDPEESIGIRTGHYIIRDQHQVCSVTKKEFYRDYHILWRSCDDMGGI